MLDRIPGRAPEDTAAAADPAELSAPFIHPTALVAPEARLGPGVRIGPFCTVGPEVELGAGVELLGHVVVDGRTRIGERARLFPFCTVGMAPQDLKYRGEPTACEVGARTVVREGATIHRGTASGGGITRVGNDCLIMANAHVAHDCVLGDRVIIVNNVVMGGHVTIDDDARVMGQAAIHQFVRIGRAAMVGGVCGVEADVIPYGSVLGNRARLVGLHWIWLRRNGVGREEMLRLRRGFRALFPRAADAAASPFARRLDALRAELDRAGPDADARLREIVGFIDAPSRRGLVRLPGRTGAEEFEGA
ncbi:MAG: acyl-ACP--UDP-N-acetylglucosamine O-acyltransferase [Gluconacetobacter diazotrophicus]|nr:acyl-ACP--UDP-N-acetylglucosamine O-acyltransferase [Gluconacetobacter diazotrophicus]